MKTDNLQGCRKLPKAGWASSIGRGATTTIRNPENDEEKSFTFDYSYWSFDGSKEDPDGYCSKDKSHPNGSKFADQVKISFT